MGNSNSALEHFQNQSSTLKEKSAMHSPENTLRNRPNSYSSKSRNKMISNSQRFYLQQNISIEHNEFYKRKSKTLLNSNQTPNNPLLNGILFKNKSIDNMKRTNSTISNSSSSRGWDSSTTLNSNVSPKSPPSSSRGWDSSTTLNSNVSPKSPPSSSRGWDSSTTLNNNVSSRTFPESTSTFDERLPSPQTSNSSIEDTKYHSDGHITDTSIVGEPESLDDLSDKTLNTSHSSVFSREHDNSSEETATLNPSLLNS